MTWATLAARPLDEVFIAELFAAATSSLQPLAGWLAAAVGLATLLAIIRLAGSLTQYHVSNAPILPSQPEVLVVLIHGTWARGIPGFGLPAMLRGTPARWVTGTDPQPALRRLRDGLRSAGVTHRTGYVYFNWSGRNTSRARRAAGARLREELGRLARQYPAAGFFLVAHSHGGNVAAHALNHADAAAIQRRLLGLACLSTPFFHLAILPKLPLARRCLAGIFFLVALAPIAAMASRNPDGVYQLWHVGHAMTALIATIGAATWMASAWLKRHAKRLAGLIAYAHLERRHVVLIRASGDEASLALGSMQAAAWLSRLALALMGGIGGLRIGRAVLVLVGTMLALGGTAAYLDPAEAMRFTAWLVHSLPRGLEGLTTIGMCFVVIVGVIVVCQVPATGPLAAALSPYLDIAVEAAPPGEWLIHYVSAPVHGDHLDHSTYSHPDAVQVLAKWFAERAGRWRGDSHSTP